MTRLNGGAGIRRIRNRVKRLFRHLFTLCSAASLVLCVAVCVLWVRSYWAVTYVERGFDYGNVYFFDVRGRASLAVVDGRAGRAPNTTSWDFRGEIVPLDQSYMAGDVSVLRLFGFEYRSFVAAPSPMNTAFGWAGGGYRVIVPNWFLAYITALLPIMRFLRRRRRLPGLCPRCGYDLRASPERCPECGALRPGSGRAGAGADSVGFGAAEGTRTGSGT
jgi:hypothetical protein